MARKKTAKEKILDILKKDHEVSIKELMDYFTISEVAVRRHLNDLIRQQFVEERVVKQDIGRPFHLYSLTRKGHETFPNQYDHLPVELLKDLEALHGKKVVKEVLLKRKEREENELVTELEKANFDDKVKRMVELQGEKGYMLAYEQTEDGHYEIKNFNCPIYNLATEFKVVCKNEKDMYRTIFPGSKITSRSCMTSGGKYCCWVISKPD